MLNRRPFLRIALVLLLAAFAFGLNYLFKLRFAAGDVYPAYSSLRGDPLGCRVYYESLEQLGNVRVRRSIQSIARLPNGRATTLFVFGLPWSEMSAEPDEFKALESFVRDGGRLVVTLYPEIGKPRNFTTGLGTNQPAFKSPLADEERRHPPINLRERWGFGLDYIPTTRDSRLLTPVTATRVEADALPEKLTWHSALVFTNLESPWQVIYARGTNPVMIARSHGQGSIVLATDSFFVSNEAMRAERRPDLLAWLAGTSREIVFDETHLGVQERPGLAQLARRYQLHGGIFALLGLAALFIWKNSVSFVPRNDDSGSATAVRGRDAAAGFENLLRRSIAPKDLLQVSLDEWHKTAQLDARCTAQRRERIRAIVKAFNEAGKPNAVETYREIARVLNRRK